MFVLGVFTDDCCWGLVLYCWFVLACCFDLFGWFCLFCWFWFDCLLLCCLLVYRLGLLITSFACLLVTLFCLFVWI